MKLLKNLQVAFLIVGALVALEFIFVRGLFTWLIAVFAIIAVGGANVIVNALKKEWLQSTLFLLCTIALCMGYFAII